MHPRTLFLVSYASVMAGLIVGLIAALLSHVLLADQTWANLVDGLNIVSQLCLSVCATAILVLLDRTRREPAIEVCDDGADENDTPPLEFFRARRPHGGR
jgi:hypothetical protein